MKIFNKIQYFNSILGQKKPESLALQSPDYLQKLCFCQSIQLFKVVKNTEVFLVCNHFINLIQLPVISITATLQYLYYTG
ncbi:hypothetical protein H1P_280033 [Hyella patelloides LEGE 07179]|uniref:Uncharacterized protein n=1 Tax=Hyella patelloides LEGE 07179 TaxID=945734 RepID=A0A563VT90_9CYAN|nr:hypothetical protein H1P_280033 [Hyella patelloides LEGE 07179]